VLSELEGRCPKFVGWPPEQLGTSALLGSVLI